MKNFYVISNCPMMIHKCARFHCHRIFDSEGTGVGHFFASMRGLQLRYTPGNSNLEGTEQKCSS